MAQYTMAELEALSQREQGGGSETSQVQNGSETFRPLPVRKDIHGQAYAVLCMANDWMSRAEVAKALGLKKTGWLNAALEKLYEHGYVDRCAIHGNGALPTFYYLARRDDYPRGH